MDHKLAIAIVPRESKDPIQASRALLERFQKAPSADAHTAAKFPFRYKRVGGWFDGLAIGRVGQERWSTVLRMLLGSAATSEASLLAGHGPETVDEILGSIEADNTLDLDDIWPHAPCSIIVTPDGKWAAHSDPDGLDEPSAGLGDQTPRGDANQAWARIKRELFWENRGATAVAWDLSWHFIAAPTEGKNRHSVSAPRAWGARNRPSSTDRKAWAQRIARARSRAESQLAANLERQQAEDKAALDRWGGEGGAPGNQPLLNPVLPPGETRTHPIESEQPLTVS